MLVLEGSITTRVIITSCDYTEERATLTLQGLCTRPTTFTPVAPTAVDVLTAAAPTTGEALHWAWLLRALAYRSTAPKEGAVLEYVARAASNVTRDASWFMLLIAQLHELGSTGGEYTPGQSVSATCFVWP